MSSVYDFEALSITGQPCPEPSKGQVLLIVARQRLRHHQFAE